MKKLLIGAALALLMTTTAHATSQQIPFYKGKYWMAYGMAKNNDGEPLCGMQSSGSDRLFYFKWTISKGMIVHVWKESWRLPKGSEVPFKLVFDDDNEKSISSDAALGEPSSTGKGSSIFMRIKAEDASDLIEAIAEANKMTIHFPGGDEPSWNANMEGTRKAAEQFKWCISAVLKNGESKQATQPVTPKATQPVNPKATQPVGPKSTQPTQPAKKKDDGSV